VNNYHEINYICLIKGSCEFGKKSETVIDRAGAEGVLGCCWCGGGAGGKGAAGERVREGCMGA